MNKLLSTMLIGVTFMASAGNVASFPTFKGHDSDLLSRMRKAYPTQRWADIKSDGQKQQRIAPHFTTHASDEFQYLFGPDGTQWYSTCDYDIEEITLEGGYTTEKLIKGFTYTIYDNKFNLIGKVRDKVELGEGETRCAAVMLDVTVTKKFFKSDDKYEVMVSLAMNTPEFVTNVRTNIYALENLADGEYSSVIDVIPGYPVDAIDCANDKWTEDYYITFLTEKTPDSNKDYPDYIDFLAGYRQILTTYTKASYSSGPKMVFEKEIRMLDLPGDQMSSPMMLCKKIDGKLALVYAHYEKSFFVDPSGMGGNEALTDDNNLIVEVYKMNDNYPSEMELINNIKIPVVQNTEDPNVYCSYYGIGNLMWDKDVDYEGHYTADGSPAVIVTVDDYLFNDDDHYNSHYYVYDTDGNKIHTIAENTFAYVKMTDLPGYEPQVMFVRTGDEMSFDFVDIYSCKSVTKVDQMYRGYGLSTSIDRVATANGYAYASALSSGIPIDDNSLYAPVCWIDNNGELIRLDKIPTGKNIELAQIYISSYALSPYVFNTDKDLEYMLLVKRRVNNSDALQEELLIATTEKGIIHSFTQDEEKGEIRTVFLMEGENPELVIAYQKNNKFITDAYELPFSRFAGGSGSDNDPYLIATAGDLQQIKNNPNASFKIVSDIDCAGVSFSPIKEFSGVLDGNNHEVNNLFLSSNEKVGLFRYCNGATVKNINFLNPSMLLEGDWDAALLASEASRTNFDNIHMRGLDVKGDQFTGLFGSICAKCYTFTNFTGCEVADADIDIPSSNSAGGIVGDMRTGSTVTGCAFSGNLTARSTVGGIVATTVTGDEVISQCHVDANLKAENTIGGIVGFLDRSKVKSNYVEGTIEATKASKWTNAIALGGIAGELEGDWEGNADVPVVNNLIGISSFIYPQLDVTEKYPHQLATVHRVVGRSSFNAEPEYDDVDSNGNPIYKDKVKYEEGVLNNYVVSGIPVVDNDFAEKSIEGTTINKEEVTTDMLAKTLGFEFGTSATSPWKLNNEPSYDPCLYFENVESGVESITTTPNVLSIMSGRIIAKGHSIDIYNLSGCVVLSGNDEVALSSLNAGVYVATAKDANGNVSSIKFVK
ncbi:MAG: hypothetical protein K2K25_03295 [Muribaculaceae bacterium]|nr:hypothetical protein [Muribaculaceae bacterium]